MPPAVGEGLGRPPHHAGFGKGGVDVARFAEQFGGGGHARASGLKLNGSFDEAYERVVSAMRGNLSKG